MADDKEDGQKDGSGKSIAASLITFGAVMIAFYLKDHYGDLMKQLSDEGYPLSFVIAGIAALITHITTWWTRQDLVAIIIFWIMNWKKIVKAWKTPT